MLNENTQAIQDEVLENQPTGPSELFNLVMEAINALTAAGTQVRISAGLSDIYTLGKVKALGPQLLYFDNKELNLHREELEQVYQTLEGLFKEQKLQGVLKEQTEQARAEFLRKQEISEYISELKGSQNTTEVAKDPEKIELSARRSGRTTRLIDDAIQELFKEGSVTVQDHLDNNEAAFRLPELIKNRLWVEHRLAVRFKSLGKGLYSISLTK